MLCNKIGFHLVRKIQVISFGIQVRIGYPVIHILNGFFISPKKFNAFGITVAIVIYSRFGSIAIIGFIEIIVFFVKQFGSKCLQGCYFLVLQNIMGSFCITNICYSGLVAAFGVLIKNTISKRCLAGFA